MKIFCDENISPSLVRGLSALQGRLVHEDGLALTVESLVETYGRGIADEEWIPLLGEIRAFVLTHDTNIKRRRQQLELLRTHGVRCVFIKRPSKRSTYWDTVVQVVRTWPKVRRLIAENANDRELLIEIPGGGSPRVL